MKSLADIADNMVKHIREANGFVKSGQGSHVLIEVDGATRNLYDWWLSKAYPIGDNGHTYFCREMDSNNRGDNVMAVGCGIACGCNGTRRSRLFRSILMRKLGQ